MKWHKKKKVIGCQTILRALGDNTKLNSKFSEALFTILEVLLKTKLVKRSSEYTFSMELKFGDKKHFVLDFNLKENK